VADYRFLTTWLVGAPREQAWDAIEDVVRWPEWWRGVVSAKVLEPGDENKVGCCYDVVWRSRLPYPVRFKFRVEKVERPGLMEGRADGELAGTGRWRLFEQDGVTAVLYEWNVQTTRPWMNMLAPVARPVFAWNHNVVMGWGGEGLARVLGAPLLARG
jgi:Polyketide cyclase / dehydrase and lipid transport